MSKECRGKPYFEEKVCELRNYKFVLGIENTLIADYVTESTHTDAGGKAHFCFQSCITLSGLVPFQFTGAHRMLPTSFLRMGLSISLPLTEV